MLAHVIRFAVVVTAACGPSVSYAPFRSAPAAPPVPAAGVEVFVAAPPCPFVELGMVEARSGYASLEDALFAMRESAGRRGADAILIVTRRAWTRAGMIYSAVAIARASSCRG